MSEREGVDAPPTERVEDVPRILAAMRRAVREAIRRHRAAGNPIATWRDGAVVWIPPEEIELEREDE
jgi:hypothetical protein